MSIRHPIPLFALVAGACLFACPPAARATSADPETGSSSGIRDRPGDRSRGAGNGLPAPPSSSGSATPPYAKPSHAVPVNAATHGEGNFVLAEMNAEERRKLLETGMVLANGRKGDDDDLTGFVRAWLIANQPRHKVFELLIQPSTQAQFLPRLVSSETVERTATTELTKFHIRVAMVNVHTHVLHQWWPEISRLAWALDPNFDNGVKHQEGYWNVYSLDENTSLLEYGTLLRTSALVPRFVQDSLTRSDLPSALDAMKRYLDSGGTWRRDAR